MGSPVITPAAAGKPQFPQSGSLFGSYSYPSGATVTQTQRKALWNKRDADAGRAYDVSNNFYSWAKPFPTWIETEALAHGRTPMVSWNGTDTTTIMAADSLAMIKARADGLRDLHAPVFLRFYWEMDGNKKASWSGGDPAKFIAAWRYVHDVFVSEGATNVAWVWAPGAWAFDVSINNGAKWYPGDDVVDWIGADEYNWAPTQPGAPYASFATIFANWYGWASQHDKPLMVAETGALERNSGDKAQWIRDMATTLKTQYTHIKALVYFDITFQETPTELMYWPVDTSTDAYQAWNTIAKDPYFNTRQ